MKQFLQNDSLRTQGQGLKSLYLKFTSQKMIKSIILSFTKCNLEAPYIYYSPFNTKLWYQFKVHWSGPNELCKGGYPLA